MLSGRVSNAIRDVIFLGLLWAQTSRSSVRFVIVGLLTLEQFSTLNSVQLGHTSTWRQSAVTECVRSGALSVTMTCSATVQPAKNRLRVDFILTPTLSCNHFQFPDVSDYTGLEAAHAYEHRQRNTACNRFDYHVLYSQPSYGFAL